MIKLRKKSIQENQELVSRELRRRREEKGLSLAKASGELQISEKYLCLLEAGRTSGLPSGVYGRNFLRRYCEYLGLDAEKAVSEYFGGREDEQRDDRELFVRKAPPAFYFLTIPRLLRNLLLFLLATALLAYLGYSVYNIVSPPYLSVDSPPADLQTVDRSLRVSGQAEAETSVYINGEAVLVDDGGRFEKSINLQSGINNIVIEARKKYSRTNYVSRTVLLEPGS